MEFPQIDINTCVCVCVYDACDLFCNVKVIKTQVELVKAHYNSSALKVLSFLR